jgi:hypothetical protein
MGKSVLDALLRRKEKVVVVQLSPFLCGHCEVRSKNLLSDCVVKNGALCYAPQYLPLSIPGKATYQILLNPKITEGLYEQSNGSSVDVWWPRKPPNKKQGPLDPIYACEFTNYGNKALLDVSVVFNVIFYSVSEMQGGFIKKNPDGTSSVTVPLPHNLIPGTPNPGIRRMAFARVRNGKTMTISPGDIVSNHRHKAVIPVIPAGHSATIYLINESGLFAHFAFPTKGDSVVTSDPKKQPIVLIRPDVNIIDKLPDYILPPATYHWVGVPDAP